MGTKQTQTVSFNGTSFKAYTYRPSGEINGVLLTFHGAGRDAALNRDVAVSLADKMGYFVVAPEFSSTSFPSSEYQMGGIIKDGKLIADRDDWTVSYAKDFAEWGAAKAGLDSSDDVILFGHSGGGQFLSRVAAYTAGSDDSGFDKMIIANPSTLVWPSLTEKAPYGFGGYFSAKESEALLKDYLADPITIYLGSEDDNPNDSDLSKSSAAMRQGDDRLERGLNAYNAAKAMAESKGWDFNWELVIADGVGHSVGGMIRAPEMLDAIDTDTPAMPAPKPTPAPAPEPKTYVFESLDAAKNAATITNYRDGDRFDFSRLDADVLQSGKQDFHFIGQKLFSRSGEEIKFVQDADLGVTWIKGSVDYDSSAEFRIKVAGLHTFTADDFIL
ncbi:alpha/beta hydrolase [Microvirga massiliensis]|uniref:alpha/beta hydrolase n=1 Tax=Microvirga massiliensis TaxID=1033741 RepID=UPI000A4ABBFA|nr:alpha/beta hydrolase [Microvirga massiliensis]